MAALDWSQCSAVESVPGRLNGAWVFRDTRPDHGVAVRDIRTLAAVRNSSDSQRCGRAHPGH